MRNLISLNLVSSYKTKKPVSISTLFQIFLILVMILLITLLIYKRYFQTKEGVVGKINDAIRGIRDVGNKVNKIPRKIDNVGKDINKIPKTIKRDINTLKRGTKQGTKAIDKAVNKGVKQIKKEGEKIVDEIDSALANFGKTLKLFFTKKLTRFFESIGKELNRTFVNPINELFKGVGKVFQYLNEILMMIINKIKLLPECVPYYASNGIWAGAKTALPRWIIDILNFFNKMWRGFLNFIRPAFQWIGIDVFAWESSIHRKCYKFDTKSKTKKMTSTMKESANKFKKDFGKLDFKKIAV